MHTADAILHERAGIVVIRNCAVRCLSIMRVSFHKVTQASVPCSRPDWLPEAADNTAPNMRLHARLAGGSRGVAFAVISLLTCVWGQDALVENIAATALRTDR